MMQEDFTSLGARFEGMRSRQAEGESPRWG